MPNARMMRRSGLLSVPKNLGATKHTMLGPGGKFVEPKSESAVLDEVLNLLSHNSGIHGQVRVDTAMRLLRELREQVAGGYHRNPRRGVFAAGEAVGKIGDDVHDIRYTHAQDGEDYEHKFSGAVEVWAILRNGRRELLLSHKDGKPLWDDF